jgi:hypothetical protein
MTAQTTDLAIPPSWDKEEVSPKEMQRRWGEMFR